MSTHVYQPLEGPEHIRLIALHPASSKDAPLQINFVSSTLEDLEGRYEAISYTWGQPILKFALHADGGTQVFVTENLDRALRHLRRADRDRLLWADAASINQADNEEKAVQIPLMVQIFRGARRVMAWLDPGRDTTIEQSGMRKLDRLSRVSGIPTYDLTKDFSEVLSLLNLPWFNRLWIVQEIVFSLDICLICGDTELAFSRFMLALSFFAEETPLGDAADRARMRAILEIAGLWNRHSFIGQRANQGESESQGQILRLIDKFGSYGCTDPRDRIFALSNMATDVISAGRSPQIRMVSSNRGSDIFLSIDYSLDVRETYLVFSWICWNHPSKHQEMWETLLSRQHSSLQANWPSWAPDWRISPQRAWRNTPRPTWWRTGLEPPEYPRIKVHKYATGILRMGFLYKGSTREDRITNLHTIHLKTSRTAQCNRTPLVSQLARLATSIEDLRNSSCNPSPLPKRISAALPTDILIDLIKTLLLRPECEDTYKELEDTLTELDRYLKTIAVASEKSDTKCNATLPSVRIQDLIHDLERELGDDELFCCQDPKTQVYSVGFGSKALEKGDRLAVLDDMSETGDLSYFTRVLILRGVCGHRADPLEPAFRLIGNGYLLDGSWSYLIPIIVKYYEMSMYTDTLTPTALEDEFIDCFDYDGYGYLNLV